MFKFTDFDYFNVQVYWFCYFNVQVYWFKKKYSLMTALLKYLNETTSNMHTSLTLLTIGISDLQLWFNILFL